ncbi:MAG: cell division protein FtsL [Defluviitaleaceae bacterium]|nr:cell division protein FtsL [Defluviitaleaceae bacterium]
MKKNSQRPRSVPTLEQREAQKFAENETKKRAEDHAKKLKRAVKKNKISRANPNAPRVMENKTARARFIIYKEHYKNFPWKKLTFTFLLVLLGGIGSVWFHARNSEMQLQINRAERELRNIHATNFTLDSQLQERYTHIEIERIASERLGMSAPDASQIINIFVPRVGGVTLNNAEEILPRHNYFWDDVSVFFSDFFNKIFGGRK